MPISSFFIDIYGTFMIFFAQKLSTFSEITQASNPMLNGNAATRELKTGWGEEMVNH